MGIVLQKFGLNTKSSTKEIIDVCQREYKARHGVCRKNLTRKQALAVMAMLVQNIDITHPSKQKPYKPSKKIKQNYTKPPQYQPKQYQAYIPTNKYKRKTPESNSLEFLESYEWRSLRYEVLKLHGAKCQLCNHSREDGLKMHVDHIKPRKHYPHLALDINNLQVLCEVCNHGKGNWDETDWR